MLDCEEPLSKVFRERLLFVLAALVEEAILLLY
jgi:hypothetical protein